MMDDAFWEKLHLEEMSKAQWEVLCDGCGRCCINKLIDDDTDELVHTNVACDLLDPKTCRCSNYAERFQYVPECIQLNLESLPMFDWLPVSCSYRCIAEGRSLPKWHPLLGGGPVAMRRAGVWIGDRIVREKDVVDLEDHLLDDPL